VAETDDYARHRTPLDDYGPPAPRDWNGAPYNPADPPGRGEAIQSLTRDVLIHRNLEISPQAFITIISIIQGVALGLLAQNSISRPSPLAIAQSVALLLILVNVFYFYLTQSVLLRWAPSFLDCFLPFFIGSLEIPPAFFLGRPTPWSAWVAAFWLMTMGGLWITKNYAPPSHFGNALHAHRLLHDMIWELRLGCGLGGLTIATCGIMAVQMPRDEVFWGFAGAVASIVTVILVVARTELRASQIHAVYGVNRPPFN
jgi:hypothetical protein